MRHAVLGTPQTYLLTPETPENLFGWFLGGVLFFVCLIFNYQMMGFKKELSNKLNNCIANLTMKWNEKPD